MRPTTGGAAICLAAVATALGGCGGSSDTPDSTKAPGDSPNTTQEQRPPAPKRQSPAYDLSKDLCAVVGVQKIAKSYGGDPTVPQSVADAYAKKDYRPEFQRQAADGCLAGL